jgi:hypothetical protein
MILQHGGLLGLEILHYETLHFKESYNVVGIPLISCGSEEEGEQGRRFCERNNDISSFIDVQGLILHCVKGGHS